MQHSGTNTAMKVVMMLTQVDTEVFTMNAVKHRFRRALASKISYGYPGTDGTLISNTKVSVKQTPFFNLFYHHPLDPLPLHSKYLFFIQQSMVLFGMNVIFLAGAPENTSNSTVPGRHPEIAGIFASLIALLTSFILQFIYTVPMRCGYVEWDTSESQEILFSCLRKSRKTLVVLVFDLFCLVTIIPMIVVVSLLLPKYKSDDAYYDATMGFLASQAISILFTDPIKEIFTTWWYFKGTKEKFQDDWFKFFVLETRPSQMLAKLDRQVEEKDFMIEVGASDMLERTLRGSDLTSLNDLRSHDGIMPLSFSHVASAALLRHQGPIAAEDVDWKEWFALGESGYPCTLKPDFLDTVFDIAVATYSYCVERISMVVGGGKQETHSDELPGSSL